MKPAKEIIREHRWLIAIILASLAVRIAAGLAMPDGINWKDGLEYDSFAASLQKEQAYLNSYGIPSAYRPPGYPVFILLSGRNPAVLRILQSLVGAATVLLVYLIALKIAGRAGALPAAAVAAIYPLHIYAAGTYYPAVLLGFLLAAVTLLLIAAQRGNSGGKALAAGALAGFMALTKGSCVPAFLLAAIWLAVENSRAGNGDGSPSGIRKFMLRLRPAALFLLPIVLMTSLWGIRNYNAIGSFRPLSTNSGYNFWLGNYPGVGADTGNRKVPGQKEEELSIRNSSDGEVEADRAFLLKGLEHVKENRMRFVALSAAKALNFWRFYPSPMSRKLSLAEKLASALSYGPVLILGLFFIFSSIRRSPEARLILLIFIGYTAVHAIFISKVRLRLPLDMLLIACCASGLKMIAGKLGFRSFR